MDDALLEKHDAQLLRTQVCIDTGWNNNAAPTAASKQPIAALCEQLVEIDF